MSLPRPSGLTAIKTRGESQGLAWFLSQLWHHGVPIVGVGILLILVWYGGAILLNRGLAENYIHNQASGEAAQAQIPTAQWVWQSLNLDRPKLPAPDQILVELKKSIFEVPTSSKRSLVYHTLVTIKATLFGAGLGLGFGLVLAILLIYLRSLMASILPWIIASQTIPIIALAPMLVVILNQLKITGVLPKAMIAAYLSFFPVTLGMVKGLTSAEPLHLELFRSYAAREWQVFLRLRLPASLPYLFASMRIGIAASLVGTIVAELTKSEDGGIGSRLLAGSYYGQTVQIWAALVAASATALILVGLVSVTEKLMLRFMGSNGS
ncbi:MAG: ABC transporter permease subunit [Candidatus Pacebacteria bacterium]|nr:ABC transporter permease subunit [Candidatus Paceibacterota bacterium]